METLSLAGPWTRWAGKVFYGWWIVGAATVAATLFSGLYYYGLSTFFLPLLTELGSSRTVLSGAFSLARLETGALGPLQGFAVDRWGPRPLMIVGMLLMGGGMMLMARTHGLLEFYLVYILMVSVGASLGFGSAPLVSVANWFIRKRSRAMGIALSGIGLGGLLVPLLGWLVEAYGWRRASEVAALIIWGIGLPAALAMRHKPEQYGMQPDGEPAVPRSDSVAERAEQEFSVREALRTGAFWLLSVFFALRLLVTTAVALHLIPYYQQIGVSPKFAALALGIVAGSSVPGRLLFGWLGERWPSRYLISISAALVAVGLLVLGALPHIWAIPLFVVLFAPADGGGSTLMFSMRAEYFGRKAYGAIGGCMGLVILAGSMAGPIIAGFVHDRTGSYQVSFYAFAGLSFLAALFMPFARPPMLARVDMAKAQA